MRKIYLFIIGSTILFSNNVFAQSSLLESVKRNPKEAISLCKRFRALNAQGISANSEKALQEISSKKNLNRIDSEILSMYVIGLHCPDVK